MGFGLAETEHLGAEIKGFASAAKRCCVAAKGRIGRNRVSISQVQVAGRWYWFFIQLYSLCPVIKKP